MTTEPTPTEDNGISAEEIQKTLEQTFEGTYHNIRFNGGGYQCYNYTANLGGPNGPVKLLRVEKGTSKRHLSALMNIADAREHNIVPLDFFHDMSEKGMVVSVHPYISGKNLEEMVSEKPLDITGVRRVFSDVIDAALCYTRNGFVHNDLWPANILISEDQTYVLDFGNASDREANGEAPQLQSLGARCVTNPLSAEEFGGTRKNKETDEVYAICHDIYYGLTGKFIVTPDRVKKTLTDTKGGMSLLDSEGKVHDSNLRYALSGAVYSLPKEAEFLEDILYKGLTSEYASIEAFAGDFRGAFQKLDERNKRIAKSKTRKFLMKIGAAVLGAATLIGGLGVAYHASRVNRLEDQVVEAERYEVVAEWNNKFGIQNNLIELDPSFSDKTKTGSSFAQGPLPKVIETNAGNTLVILPYVYEKPFPKKDIGCLPNLRGAVYVEGFDKKEFSTWPLSQKPDGICEEGYTGPPFVELSVPNVKDGNYTLAVEVYAPLESDADKHQSSGHLKHLKFKEPGRILSRTRIPMVVGNPRSKIFFEGLGLNFAQEHFGFKEVDKFSSDGKYIPNQDPRQKLTYEVGIPGADFKKVFSKENFDFRSAETSFPRIKRDLRDNFQYVVRDEAGNLVTFGMMPVKTSRLGKEEYLDFMWDLDIPERNFSDQLRTFYNMIEPKQK